MDRRNVARQIAKSWKGRTSRRLRKKFEMLFAHLKRILKLDRLRLRGPNGARDEFLLAATAQNFRKLAKLIPMPNIQSQPKNKAEGGPYPLQMIALWPNSIAAGLVQQNRSQTDVTPTRL
jgi:Transposase DDE domain